VSRRLPIDEQYAARAAAIERIVAAINAFVAVDHSPACKSVHRCTCGISAAVTLRKRLEKEP
jgi:hypothetical protein